MSIQQTNMGMIGDDGEILTFKGVWEPSGETIAVGESRQIGITFAPDTDVAEGMYIFHLHLESSNYQTTDIDLNISVTQSGVGNILFKVQDIYTLTMDADNQQIQGVADARVKLQNEEVLTEEYTLNTDSVGEAYFTDLPAGHYKCRITANNHREYIGRVWIKPGVSANEEVFLDYNLVTVEWEVNEITIEDKYEIVLNATYETDVPAAVVIAEPSSITLPAMKAGDVYNGEFTLTNYGLIRADNVTYTMPEDDQYFHYELLQGLPSGINAKDRITVAFRITCIQSPDQSEGDGTGGGCERSAGCAKIDYDYTCPAGKVFHDSGICCFIYDNGQCNTAAQGGGTGNAGGGTWNLGGGGGGSSNVSVAQAPSQVAGVKCFPGCDRKECFCEKCRAAQKESLQNSETKTLSSVNTVLREYNRDHVDLFVKVPGGKVEIKRWYYNNQWYWEHTRNHLSFKMDSLGAGIESIDKGGVIYRVSPANEDIFTSDVYRIIRKDTGWRWEDNHGRWREFDQNGNMTSFGSRSGIVGKLLYDNDRLTGYTDRNDNQVLWIEYDANNKISAVHDIDNRRVEYGYTAEGLLSSVTDVLGNNTAYQYDGEGRIIKTIDAAGREANVTYDGYGNVSSVVDQNGNGHFFEFDYNSAKKEFYARITTSSGMIKEIWYDRNGDTKRVDVNGRTIQKIDKDRRNLIITDEKGNITRKEFDEWDNLTKITYSDGSVKTYEYEHTFNRRIRETDENGITTEFEYDANGNLTRKVEASGADAERTTEYTYDGSNNLLTTTRPADAHTAEAVTTMTYDDAGNMTSVTDPEGNTTFFTHDLIGNVLTKTDAGGKVWTYEYDAAGHLIKVTDPLNNITQMFYDGAGNKIKEIDAEGKQKLFEYDVRNNLIKITDASGNETLFEYNTDGKLVKQTDPEGKVINYQYDNEGRLVKTIDGNGNEIAMEYSDTSGSGCSSCSGGKTNQPSKVTYPTFEKTFAYDTRGRKISETDILSDTESYLTNFTYDAAGSLISRTDKESETTGYTYDALNRLKKVTDPLDQEIVYTYDNRDNLIQLTDAKGQITQFEYDKNNRLTKETRPMGEATTYTYDATGNLVSKIDAKNQKTEYIYDDAGRLEQIKYFNPADHVNPVKTVTFTYDKVGNLTGYDDGTTSATYTYDDNYRKVSETVNYGTFSLTNTYTYNKNNTKKTFTGPDNITYGYLYDANNQLTGVQIPNVGFITISEYTWNRPKSMTLPGGSTRQFTYDPLMRTKQITAKDPGQNILLNYQYTYDKMDNITAKTTEHGNYQYGYDDLYRLNTVDNPDFDDESFSYDPVGNRMTSADTTGNWSYNTNNELTGYDDASYIYDDNGNMTQKIASGVVTKFFYNTEDRLSEVRDGNDALIASYYYDPFGRRLWKEVSGVRTYFHYSDEGLVAELDASGNVTKTYGYKPNSTWTTDPLFMKIGPDHYFYQNDHLGTPQKLTAVNGAVVWAAKYSSFGKASVDTSSTVTNNLRFPGQYFDDETGLHYNLHRYYDPEPGNYLISDPIGLIDGINLYVYVLDNPIVNADPFGLMSSVGGGFGITGGLFSVSISIHTETCCNGKKRHTRTIRSFCWGIQLGFSIRTGETMGPGTASVSIGGKKLGKCQYPKNGQDTYQVDNNNFGFSSGVGLGASWSTEDPTATTMTAGQVGFSIHIYSECNRKILQDVESGCCK